MIRVTKKNEVYLKVDCDPSTSQEISEFFTFDVPGAKFMPSYKSRMWDGKARLFNMYRQELYVGLLPYLQEFAETLEYKIEVDIKDVGEPVSSQYVENLAKKLNLQSGGKDIEIRDYQVEAVRHSINKGRALLLSPTASGKSLIIYNLVRYHQHLGRKQLLIVPTTSLVEQMFGDFGDYSTADDWQVSENCHRIYGGKEKSNEAAITISTWQSIYKFPKQWFEQFDVVYGDEAHNFKAKSLTSILDKCSNAPYRIGTTGTLDGTKTHKLVLEGIFGAVKKVITTKKLMEQKSVADLAITCLLLDYCDEDVRQLEHIFKILQGWEQPKFHLGVLQGKTKQTSPISGGVNLALMKTITTNRGTIKRIMKDLDAGRLFEMSESNYQKYLLINN